MNGEFLPRRRMAESVFNTLGLDMPRSHSDVQSFVRRFRDIQENRRPSYRVSDYNECFLRLLIVFFYRTVPVVGPLLEPSFALGVELATAVYHASTEASTVPIMLLLASGLPMRTSLW